MRRVACRSRVCCRTGAPSKTSPRWADARDESPNQMRRVVERACRPLEATPTPFHTAVLDSSGRGGCETRGGAQTAGEIQDLLRAGDAFAKIESVSSCNFRKAACKPKPNNAELMESPYSFTLRQVTRFGKNFNAPLVLQGSVTLLQHRNGIRSQSAATLRRPRPPWRRASCARVIIGSGKPCAASAKRVVYGGSMAGGMFEWRWNVCREHMPRACAAEQQQLGDLTSGFRCGSLESCDVLNDDDACHVFFGSRIATCVCTCATRH